MKTTLEQRSKLFELEQLTCEKTLTTDRVELLEMTIREVSIMNELEELGIENSNINEYISRGITRANRGK